MVCAPGKCCGAIWRSRVRSDLHCIHVPRRTSVVRRTGRRTQSGCSTELRPGSLVRRTRDIPTAKNGRPSLPRKRNLAYVAASRARQRLPVPQSVGDRERAETLPDSQVHDLADHPRRCPMRPTARCGGPGRPYRPVRRPCSGLLRCGVSIAIVGSLSSTARRKELIASAM